ATTDAAPAFTTLLATIVIRHRPAGRSALWKTCARSVEDLWKIGARQDIFDARGPVPSRSHHGGAASPAASLALLPPVAKIDARLATLRGVNTCEQRTHHSDDSRSILRHRGPSGGRRSLARADRRRPGRGVLADAVLWGDTGRCRQFSDAVAWSGCSRSA